MEQNLQLLNQPLPARLYEYGTVVDVYKSGNKDHLYKGVIDKGVVVKVGSAEKRYLVAIFAHPDYEPVECEEWHLHLPHARDVDVRAWDPDGQVQFLVKNRKAKSKADILDGLEADTGVWVVGTVKEKLTDEMYLIEHPVWDNYERGTRKMTSEVNAVDMRSHWQ